MRFTIAALAAFIAVAFAIPAARADFPRLGIFRKKTKDKEEPPQHVKQLVDVLKSDPDEKKRKAAAEELRQHDPRTNTDLIPTLINSLQAPTPPRRSGRRRRSRSASSSRSPSRAGVAPSNRLSPLRSKPKMSARPRREALLGLPFERLSFGRSESSLSADNRAAAGQAADCGEGTPEIHVAPRPARFLPGSARGRFTRRRSSRRSPSSGHDRWSRPRPRLR